MGKKQLRRNSVLLTHNGEDIIWKVFLFFGLGQYTSMAKQMKLFPPATKATERT